MEEKLYTAGIFANKAGVTIRTIRFYDKQGLLRPSAYSDSGYRLYTDSDFAKLQRILTLKYIGFSLADIKTAIDKSDAESNLKTSLQMQKEAMHNKIAHMKLVIDAIDKAEDMVNTSENLDWDKVIDIIRVINAEKSILEQYRNSSNLVKRINIHDKFSVNKTGWYKWLMSKFRLASNMKVLELGCGNGVMWQYYINEVPESCEIMLTDLSEGMLNDTRLNLKEYVDRFNFKLADAHNIPFKDESFDVVIADHMLFYCNDRRKVFEEVQRVLKKGGYFYCSTVGKGHMKDLEKLLYSFHKDLVMSEFDIASEFGLENGENQLSEFFQQVKRYDYEDNLLVTEAEPLVQYVYSTHGNVNEVLKDRREQFEEYVEEEMHKAGSIFITKKSGLFESRKL
ncbi:MerR family transcriptional regulator [Inconstantimicrobium mannanitabidum]|uniref:MerR family transcriptional regulator n=1 Tax=Inconstantimicrobium mannanitabidum TaxID=1604901 RepID=A0ACB5RGF4_9CLOT|nr:MerR family transcriptional regulator [Clostridium sp. TW13]GKX68171.1 MerR family transcriptional regulator [Clostridium sp. TW13]